MCRRLPFFRALYGRSRLAARSRERPAGATPPTLPCNCRFVGPVPLHSAFSLIGTTCCRPTPLHAGMANPYQGRLRLRNRLDPTIPWFSCRYSPITPRKFKLIPSVSQRLNEMIHQLIAVMRGWRYAEPFVAPRHGRIIDRLYVDAMFPQEKVGDQFAFLGIADMHRHDVGFARHDGQACRVEH